MFFFFSLVLHSLVKTWPYYRSQAPAHHCCCNLIRERTLTLSESGFLIVLVKQSLKEGTQWLQRIFLRKWNKEEVRIHGNVTGYHGFHPEFWKSRITSKLCSEKNSCLVQRHENWYKTLVQSLWGKKRGTQRQSLSPLMNHHVKRGCCMESWCLWTVSQTTGCPLTPSDWAEPPDFPAPRSACTKHLLPGLIGDLNRRRRGWLHSDCQWILIKSS